MPAREGVEESCYSKHYTVTKDATHGATQGGPLSRVKLANHTNIKR